MGAIRRPKPIIPDTFEECKPASKHNFKELYRDKLKDGTEKVTRQCSKCGKVAIIHTRPISKTAFKPPPLKKKPRP